MDDLARAYAMERRFDERLSTRTEAFRHGTAFFDEEHPERYVSNFLCAETALDEADAGALVRAADEILGGAGYAHRMLLIRSEAHGRRLADGLAAAGYEAERVLLMKLRRDPDRPPSVGVEEVPFAGARPVILETYRRDGDIDPSIVERFTDQHGKYERVLGTRFFVGMVDGRAAGVCELWMDGADALVEHVDTLEEFRNRGVARSVVLAAIDAAEASGAEHIFIGTDDDDWPKELYGRLGFDPIGLEWEFIRPPM